MKDQKQIEEMADKYTKKVGIDAMSGYRFFSFKHGYTQAQKDLLESASEGWEEWKDRLTSGGNYQVNRLDLHEMTYRNARLGMMKAAASIKVSEKNQHLLDAAALAAIEKLVNEIKQLKEDLDWTTSKLKEALFSTNFEWVVNKCDEIRKRHGLDKEEL